jgi:hypothetical protein
MANIVGEEIPKYTTDQIRVRQNLHGKGSPLSGLRNASEISLLNSNTSWVKLASGVSVTQDKLKSLNLNSSEYVGMGLAKSHVLFGGVSTLSGDSTNQWLYPKQFNTGLSGYSHSTDFGIVPMPGIIDVSIKTLNRGSIKKASVKLKAYSREQFEILDVLYLRLGFTVLLEWGNVNYLDNDGVNYRTVGGTLIEDSKRFFNPAFTENKSYLDLLGPIEYYRKKYQGNYDGFLGKISNFSWSFNEDGSYDISLEIISLGDVIESLKSNVSIDSKLNTYIEQFRTDENSIPEGEPSENSFLTPYENNNIITSMLWLWKFLNRDNSGETNNGVSITTGNGVRGFIGRILDLTNTELQVYKILLVEKGNNSNIIFEFPERPYISDDEIQKNVNQVRAYLIGKNLQDALNDSYTIIDYAFRVVDEEEIDIVYERYTALEVDTLFTSTHLPPIPVIRLNTPEKDHYIRFEYLLQYIKEKVLPNVKTNGASNPPIFNIEYGRYSNKMYSLPNQISLDPRVCLVRNDKFFKSGSPDIPAKVLSELIPFRAVDYNSNASPNTAYPMNIYLNFNFVVDSLNSNTDERGDVGLFGFLSSICDGLNKALGGINNLEPIIDESSNTLKIIDSTPIPGLTKDKGNYTLEVFGYNEKQSNFIRKIDLQTAITPEYATMVTVGATAGGYVKGVEATAFSNWNKGLIDRFKTEFTTANTKEEEGEVVDEAEKNYVEQLLSKFINCYGFAAPNGWSNGRVQIKFVDDIIGSNLSVGTEYFKYLQNKNKAGGAIGFIPFKFSFVMDGLAGFKIYNKLHISTRFLPRNYGDTLDFIITGITHDLKDNNWETSIQTQVIPKTTEISDLEISEEYIKQTIADVNSSGGGFGTAAGASSAGFKPSGYGEIYGACGTPIKTDLNAINKNNKTNQVKAQKLIRKVVSLAKRNSDGAIIPQGWQKDSGLGKCARGVKNLAEKYWEYFNNSNLSISSLTTNFQFKGGKFPGGGAPQDAKSKNTHDALIREFGYKRVKMGSNLSKNEVISLSRSLNNKANIGDIMIYWDTSKKINDHQKYGHIQMYIGNNQWVSDFIHSSFVYSDAIWIGECWELIYLQAPNKEIKIKN